jgi:GMP synthase (glutamine-hydrolysing)
MVDIDTQANKEPSPEIFRPTNRIAVMDYGGQYVDLIEKACQRLGFPAEVIPFDTPVDVIEKNYGAVIMSGSPASSQEKDAPMPSKSLWNAKVPVLGICYGMHAMVSAHGGKVIRGDSRQDGRVTTEIDISHPLFHDTKANQTALFTHGNFVEEVPESFTVLGKHQIDVETEEGLVESQTVVSAIARDNKVAVQFHPEVFDDSPEGYQIFKNFFSNIAELEPDLELLNHNTDAVIAGLRTEIREAVGEKHVIAFVSGGVDSSVATALAASEIPPERLHAYYIDNGFMRDEDDAVIDLLKHLGVQVKKIDATEQFLNATITIDGITSAKLRDVTDPQQKRLIIGKTFIDIQNQIVKDLGLDSAMLLQGTNAADRIESGNSKGSKQTAVIKTHHNQVKEVAELKEQGLLIEPLSNLFKDEVRIVGRHLGLPTEVVDRHPFPGPGLAIRILTSRGDERLSITINDQVNRFVAKDPALSLSNTKALVLPLRNVGVGGDERSHVAPVAITSETATWEQISKLATSIPARFRDQINRVIFALGPQLLENMTVTPTTLGDEERLQLRLADKIVFEEMRKFDVIKDIKQCPVVLLPLCFGNNPGQRSIVLRPVHTSTFMTVQAMVPDRDLPADFVHECTRRILKEVSGISQVFLDMTNKPPGTTEWE